MLWLWLVSHVLCLRPILYRNPANFRIYNGQIEINLGEIIKINSYWLVILKTKFHINNFEEYGKFADHILHHFNEAFAAYMQYKYAFQNLLQYINTNRALDELITNLIDSKKIFVFVGEISMQKHMFDQKYG